MMAGVSQKHKARNNFKLSKNSWNPRDFYGF